MPDFLTAVWSSPAVSPVDVVTRLLVALLLGVVVAWVYRRTRPSSDFAPTFPSTLVMLSVLIAMVTQVIGDSVARAFSLVGALSIVRFRTVVRDTQDTAFVILAVVVGMAIGARDPWVAVIGLAVVSLAAIAMRPKRPEATISPFVMSIRVAVGHDLNETIGPTLDLFARDRRLLSVGTVKQGMAVSASYHVRLRRDKAADELVKALNRIEGVQSVELVSDDLGEPVVQ
jgi:Domain of unknown function (DUF4956)